MYKSFGLVQLTLLGSWCVRVVSLYIIVYDSFPPLSRRASGGNKVLVDSGYEGFQLVNEVNGGDDSDDQGDNLLVVA